MPQARCVTPDHDAQRKAASDLAAVCSIDEQQL